MMHTFGVCVVAGWFDDTWGVDPVLRALAGMG